MGEVRVPAAAKWRAQTQRAVENFPISGRPIERELIGALASIKGASAALRGSKGMLDAAKADAIHDSAVEVARGDWDAEFPIDVFQTGSGTSSNMNTNEVLGEPGRRAARLGRAPQRRRQRPVLVQRPVPGGDPHRRHPGDLGRSRAGTRASRRGARGQGRRVRDRRQVRTHPPDGRHAGDPRPGVRRLRGAGALRRRAAARRAAPRRRAAAGRDRGGHRHQRPGRPGRRGDRQARRGHGPAAHRGARPLRGAGRRATRSSRRAARCARSRSG